MSKILSSANNFWAKFLVVFFSPRYKTQILYIVLCVGLQPRLSPPSGMLLQRLILFLLLAPAFGHCPQLCNNRGTCDPSSRCTCLPGYTGWACEKMSCPSGLAFVAKASPDPALSVHGRSLVCSGRGSCDGRSGTCVCLPGFGGRACEHSAYTCIWGCVLAVTLCLRMSSQENYARMVRHSLFQTPCPFSRNVTLHSHTFACFFITTTTTTTTQSQPLQPHALLAPPPHLSPCPLPGFPPRPPRAAGGARACP